MIAQKARNIVKESAFNYIGGYVIALDMTARDIQDTLKKAGNPWYLAKSFDNSCPVGEFIDRKVIPDPHNIEIYCKGNCNLHNFLKMKFVS